MKEEHYLEGLGPRIKLFKRHVLEWNNLLVCQREVQCLLKEEISQVVLFPSGTRIAMAEWITKKVFRLNQLALRQAKDRHQMNAYHRQEEIDLEEVLAKKESYL